MFGGEFGAVAGSLDHQLAHTAALWVPAIKPFYDRLRATGKPANHPKGTRRCAAARKLLQLSWALVTKQQKCAPQHRQPQHPETALAS